MHYLLISLNYVPSIVLNCLPLNLTVIGMVSTSYEFIFKVIIPYSACLPMWYYLARDFRFASLQVRQVRQ